MERRYQQGDYSIWGYDGELCNDLQALADIQGVSLEKYIREKLQAVVDMNRSWLKAHKEPEIVEYKPDFKTGLFERKV